MRVVGKVSSTRFIVRSLVATAPLAKPGEAFDDFWVSRKTIFTTEQLKQAVSGNNVKKIRLSAAVLSMIQNTVNSMFPVLKAGDDLIIAKTVITFLWDWGAADPDRLKIVRSRVGLNQKIMYPGLGGDQQQDEPYHFYGVMTPKIYIDDEKLLEDYDMWLEDGYQDFKILDFTQNIFNPANIVEYLSADKIIASSKADLDVHPGLYDELCFNSKRC
jgi:hypothetical protein